MRGAVRGYSGFFDFVTVDQDCLDRVYRHDMSLIVAIDELALRVEGLSVDDDAAKLS